jgi:hypothetical protein
LEPRRFAVVLVALIVVFAVSCGANQPRRRRRIERYTIQSECDGDVTPGGRLAGVGPGGEPGHLRGCDGGWLPGDGSAGRGTHRPTVSGEPRGGLTRAEYDRGARTPVRRNHRRQRARLRHRVGVGGGNAGEPRSVAGSPQVIASLHAVGGKSPNLTADLPGCERMMIGIFRI